MDKIVSLLRLGGLAYVIKCISTDDIVAISIWFVITLFAVSFAIDDSVNAPIAWLAVLLTLNLFQMSLSGSIGMKVAYGQQVFEIADRELVRVSNLVDEMQEKIDDLENKIKELELRD